MDSRKDNRILNSMAVQILLTEKPSIKLPANKIINAFIISKNNPKVNTVIGSVKITKIGFIKRFNNDKTTDTIIAVVYPSTWTPGKTCAKINTANADNKSLSISFIL